MGGGSGEKTGSAASSSSASVGALRLGVDRAQRRQVRAASTGRNAPATTSAQRIADPVRSGAGASARRGRSCRRASISSTPNTRPITAGGAVRWSSVRPGDVDEGVADARARRAPASATAVFGPGADQRRAARPRARSRARSREASRRPTRANAATAPMIPPMPEAAFSRPDAGAPEVEQVERGDDDEHVEAPASERLRGVEARSRAEAGARAIARNAGAVTSRDAPPRPLRRAPRASPATG